MTTDFKIAAAQVPAVRGDLVRNVATHASAIAAAAGHGVSVLVFPELSLTGYEPDLAGALALDPADDRLAPLAVLAQRHRMDVVAGAPLRNPAGLPYLGAIRFQADGPTRTYSKMHLGGSEPTHFAPGREPLTIAAGGQTIGLAICADSGQPSHPRRYAEAGATVYAAGVFLNAEWYVTDTPRLAGHAARYPMLVLMANHAASTGTYQSVGRSAAWAPGGALLAQAAGTEDCLVIATSAGGGWRGQVVQI